MKVIAFLLALGLVGGVIWLMVNLRSRNPVWPLAMDSAHNGSGFGPWFHRLANHENTSASPYVGPREVQVRWKWEAPSEVAAPVVDGEGNLYTASATVCYCLSPEGKQQWTFDVGGNFPIMSPTVSCDGTVYLWAGYQLYAVTSPGRLKWKTPVGSPFPQPLFALARDGKTIYCSDPTVPPALVALDTRGQVKWRHAVPGWGLGGLVAVSPQGFLYLLGGEMKGEGDAARILVQALQPDGTLRWEKILAGTTWGSVLLAHDLLYVVTLKGHLYALDLEGNLRWEYQIEDCSVPTYLAASKEFLYVGGSDVGEDSGAVKTHNHNVYAFEGWTLARGDGKPQRRDQRRAEGAVRRGREKLQKA